MDKGFLAPPEAVEVRSSISVDGVMLSVSVDRVMLASTSLELAFSPCFSYDGSSSTPPPPAFASPP